MPDEQNKSVILFVRVKPELNERIKWVASQNKWKIADMMRAALEKFMDDETPKVQQQSFKLS